MLVLGRKDKEGVVFYVDGRRFVVRVERDGSRTAVSIDAPLDVKIVREELERGAA